MWRAFARLSGQDLVPIIEHDGRVVHDSWSIACHLEDRFPDRPSLFGGAAGRGAARLVNIWSDTVLGPRDAPADLARISSGASIPAIATTSAARARRSLA